MTKIKRIVSVILVLAMVLALSATALVSAAEITSAQSISVLADGSSAALSDIEKAISSGTKDANGIYYGFKFPAKIKLGSDTIGAEEYTLMAASALYALSEGETADTLIGYQDISFRTDNAVCGSGTTVNKGQYLDLAMRAHDYGGTLSKLASSYNRPSDGTNTYNGRVSVYSMAHIFAEALASYAANGKLPEVVSFYPSHPTNVTIEEPTASTAAPTTAKPSATTAKPTTATTATTAKPTTATTAKPTTAKPSTTNAATSSATASSKSSLAIIALEAYQVEQFVLENGCLPNYCTLDNGLVYTCPEMLYMWCKAVIDINGGKTTNTYSSGTISAPENPQGTATSGTIYLEEIIDMAERNYKWIGENGQAPNYCTISTGTLQYENLVYFFARTMSFYHEEGRLPDYCGVAIVEDTTGGDSGDSGDTGDAGSSTPSAGDAVFGNNFSSYSKYLARTSYCHSDNATIISVAKTGMKYGSTPTTTYQAMYNLFEYLNDKTHYDYYYNTEKGATGVWSSKYGNCCDMAHLMNACARSLGVPGRYVHGYCRFSSGLTTGHVWSEVCTNSSTDKWYTADLVSDYNYLGYKTSSTLELYSRYVELPF